MNKSTFFPDLRVISNFSRLYCFPKQWPRAKYRIINVVVITYFFHIIFIKPGQIFYII